MVITPSIAQEMLSRNTRNRRVKDSVVDRYASDMRKGIWKRNGETIKIAHDGTILDGQHRLLAVIKSGIPLVTEVTTGLDSDSIYTIDCGSSRSASDSLKIDGVKNYSQVATISAAFLMTVTYNSAMPYYSRTGRFPKSSVAGTISYFNSNSEELEILASKIKHSNASAIVGLPVMDLIYCAGSHISKDEAEYFVEKMATGEGLNSGDPILETRNAILNAKASKSHIMPISVRNALAIKAWNKFITGESVKNVLFRRGGSRREAYPEMIDYDYNQIDYREALPTNGLTF